MVQTYTAFMKSRAKKINNKKKKNPDSVVNMTTPDGVILTTSPHPLEKPVLGKKKKLTTRVRGAQDPRCLTEADMLQSTPPQESLAGTVATLPSHGRGWPQETVPYSTSHVMGGDLENCSLGRYKKQSTDSAD